MIVVGNSTNGPFKAWDPEIGFKLANKVRQVTERIRRRRGFGDVRELKAAASGDGNDDGTQGDSFLVSFYFVAQIIAAGGTDDSIDADAHLYFAALFLVMLFVGLAVLSRRTSNVVMTQSLLNNGE